MKNIPYPPRMTVLESNAYANPSRGKNSFFESGRLLRLWLTPVLTRKRSPGQGLPTTPPQPVTEALVTLGLK